MGSAEAKPSPNGTRQRSRAEWVSLGISLLVLGSVVGTLIYLWARDKAQTPPHVTVTPVVEVRQQAGQFYVPFSVTNKGDRTAESVQVTAELVIDGEVIETGEQRFEFLSGDEVREGAFVFSQDPKLGNVRMRVSSYKLP